MIYLKTHTGEKLNQCIALQCDTVSYYASPLNWHTMEKSQTNVISVTMPLLRQAIWGHIKNAQWRKVKQVHLCLKAKFKSLWKQYKTIWNRHHVSSKGLLNRKQCHIGLTFFQCVFSNVSSNSMPVRMQSRIDCICFTFLHCAFLMCPQIACLRRGIVTCTDYICFLHCVSVQRAY